MSDREAIVVPGGQYGPYTALLTYAAEAAENRGAHVHPISWDRPEDRPAAPAEILPWVDQQVSAALDRLASPGAKPLVIAKSLGTYAAGQAAARSLPAVWLTPLLTHRPVVEALRASTEPFLLVGGAADEAWDGDLARDLSPHVLEIAGADHGMFVPGRLAASAEVLGRVVTAIEDFLDETVWPL